MKLTLTLVATLLLLAGCSSRTSTPQVDTLPIVEIQTEALPTPPLPTSTLPTPPKKNLKLKEIKDRNYSDKYMYPDDTKAAKKDPVIASKTVPVTHSDTTGTMTKEACITMISQEKFDKYTAMFGSESASLKRCAMIKAMNK